MTTKKKATIGERIVLDCTQLADDLHQLRNDPDSADAYGKKAFRDGMKCADFQSDAASTSKATAREIAAKYGVRL